MRVAFFHDAVLVRGNDEKVYSVGFPYKVWERYLAVFDTIIVSTRIRGENSNDNFMTKNKLLSSGPKVEFKPVSKYSKNLDKIINRKEIQNQIRESLEKSDCAIIRLPSVIGNVACREAIKMGKPYLVEIVGCAWDALWNHSYKGKLVAPYMYYQTKKHVRSTRSVIYVTEKFLQSRYPTNGPQTNCSNVSLQGFSEYVLEKRIERINKNKDKVVLGTTAVVDVRYKGQQYVIEALGTLKKQGVTNFEYHLVGDGDSSFLKKVAIENNVEELVIFVGGLPHNKIFDWLDDNVDIYVQPSRTEGLPRALIEAMSRGLPSFGARAGGIPELLEENYIFSNTKHNIGEICDILLSFNKESMLQQAQRNFMEAKKYDRGVIENRRKEFLEIFKSSI